MIDFQESLTNTFEGRDEVGAGVDGGHRRFSTSMGEDRISGCAGGGAEGVADEFAHYRSPGRESRRGKAYRRVDRVNASDSKHEKAVFSEEKTADYYVRSRDNTVSRPVVLYRRFVLLVKTSCGEGLRDLRGRGP
jgi:hypothetical protein